MGLPKTPPLDLLLATFFECATAMAFCHFRDRGVRVAVVETGLGGRLDATNVVMPLVSVITRIGLEHQAYLGDTLETIAGEKGGIIKQGRPLVLGAMPEKARTVLRRLASERQAPLYEAESIASIRVREMRPGGFLADAETSGVSYGKIELPLNGTYQVENLATALTVLDAIADAADLRVPVESVKQGLKRVRWPGRCQVVKNDPPVLVDGAHNPDAAEALARTLKGIACKRPVGLVTGICGDKDVEGILRPLARVAGRLWAVRLVSFRQA